jgi:hypothetical protein
LDTLKMRKYPAAPHPFLLELPPAPQSGPHQLGLTLVGRGNAYLPYLIHALQRAGEQGLGKRRTPMTLVGVWQAQPPESDAWVLIYEPGGTLNAQTATVPSLPAPPHTIRLRFETPLRLQRNEHLVTPDAFRFADFFGPLLRRVSMLTYFHTETPLDTDFAGIMEEARQLDLTERQLVWKDWTRYSSRQKTTMEMGGLVGEIGIQLPEACLLWPYLWLGQWVHVGKGTSMGLGRYSIEMASLPNEKVAAG